MALSILDGNQSATTLSTILSSGQHITAHTVVSLGTQAITDVRSAVSGSVVSISNFPATQPISGTVTIGNTVSIAGTVTANPTGTQTIAGSVTLGAGTAQIGSVTASIIGTVPVSISSVTVGNSITIGSCVTHGVTIANTSVTVNGTFFQATQPVSLASLPALAAGTAQIGSVTASISGTVPISISSVTIGNSVTIGSLPLIGGTVTANAVLISPSYQEINAGIDAYIGDFGALPISGTVTAVNHQGTTVTTSNFTSTTPSTILASANSGREVLTIFNEGAGNLHICAGATCTTIAYQVRLSAGDYYEVPLNQTSLTHSAVFATAGTARVTEVS